MWRRASERGIVCPVPGLESSTDGQRIPERLRVGINFGNPLLASRDPASGTPSGIAIDVARELGRRLGAALDIVGYSSANLMADAVRAAAWDVAFLATDPARAGDIAFTSPYLEIEATYLVREESPVRTVSEVDRDGARIAVSDRSAYDLFLTRTIARAALVRAPSVDASVDLFFAQRLDALAGLTPLLAAVADTHPGTRVVSGRFTEIRQAIGLPHGRSIAELEAFVRDVRSSGFVAAAIERHGIRGVVVPTS